jgi:hypothetical protein
MKRARQVVDAAMRDEFALSVHKKMQKDHNGQSFFSDRSFADHTEEDIAL